MTLTCLPQALLFPPVKFHLLRLASFLLITAPLALAAPIDGKWRAEFDTQVGVQKYTFELKADGEKLSGTATFERMEQKGSVPLKDGKITGDKITFIEPLRFQDNEITVTYVGTLAGDEIKFTRQVGEFATETLAAKRVPAETAAKPAAPAGK